MIDRIFVSNLRIHGFHGVKDAEKSLGQKFHIDIACDVERNGERNDTMTSTVCYGELCQLAEEVSSAQSFNLVETLAERIATAIFDTFATVKSVELTIRKPNAPVSHVVDHVGVSIKRLRNG